MATVLLHEEIPEGRTCLHALMPGEKILATMLCLRKGCITCMASKYTQQLGRERAGSEGKGIIVIIKFHTAKIHKMNSLQIIGILADYAQYKQG
eukprot:5334599-Heterocapsa_arctica.AAC.1